MECWDRHQNQNWDHIDLTIFVGCQSKSNSLCHLENESVATTRYHVPHTYPWEWWASCTQVFDNKSRSHQPWDPRVGPLAPPLSSILRVRSICCPILTKTKCPLKPPFFSSIMQFGKLFDHEMFLFWWRDVSNLHTKILYLRSISHQPINLELFDTKLLEKSDFKNVVFNTNSNQLYLAI